MSDAYDLAKLAWGDERGWVFLSTLNRESGVWKDIPYRWPEDAARVERALGKAGTLSKDVYWAPGVYTEPHRRQESVKPLNVLFADLDNADPKQLKGDLKPTAVWETSPGRWQAVWKLEEPLDPESHRAVNQALTYQIGADKGGWGLTKVLRIPDTPNHKYADLPLVKMEYLNGKTISTAGLARLVTLGTEFLPGEDGLGDERLRNPDVVLDEWGSKLRARAKTLIRARAGSEQGIDRSRVLWELSCLLAEAGLSVGDIVSITRSTVWNKHRGRADEVDQLAREARKAVAHAKAKVSQNGTGSSHQRRSVTTSEELGDERTFETWFEFDRKHQAIRWLVNDIWGVAEVGFISGVPKSYKSWLALDLAVSVATGTPFLNTFGTRRTNVLLIQAEDPRAVIQDRLARIGGAKGLISWEPCDGGGYLTYDLPDNLYVVSGSDFAITDDSWLDTLRAWIRERDIGLIILDPLMMMASGFDEFKAFEMMGTVFKPLKQLRAETNAAIVVVHHHSKSDEKTGAKAMYGSVAGWAWEEAAMHLEVVGQGKIVAERFSKHALLGPITIAVGDYEAKGWDPTVSMGVTGVSLVDILAEYSDGISLTELAQKLKLSRDTMQTQLKKLEEGGKVERGKSERAPGTRGRRPDLWRLRT